MNYCSTAAKVRISRKILQAWHKKTSIFVLKISRKIHLEILIFLASSRVLQKNYGFGWVRKKSSNQVGFTGFSVHDPLLGQTLFRGLPQSVA